MLIAEFHLRGGEYAQAYEVLKGAPRIHPDMLHQFEATALAAQHREAPAPAMDAAQIGPELGAHAMIRAGVSDLDAALLVARTLAEQRMLPLEGMWGEGARELREHPQFVELLRETGLMDYWRRYGWPDACGQEVQAALCG